MKQLINVVCLS